MLRFLRSEKGNMLVFTVFAMVSLMGFASLAIDVGCLTAAKNQLQSAADASALAAASGLLVDASEAVRRAALIGGMNTCLNRPVYVGPENVEFLGSNRVRVTVVQNVPLYFAKVVGVHSVRVSASAAAEIGNLAGTYGLRPWSVPDMNWTHGTAVVLKSGSLGAPGTNPSFYYPIDFPPMNTGDPVPGASAYEYNIVHGSDCLVSIGDELQVEPGNMVGPTRQGVDALISMDPSAYWDGEKIAGSLYPGMTSPRIVKIPLFDPNNPPDSGRNYVTVVDLAAFFVTDMQGKDVIGIFLEKISSGPLGGGNDSLLRGVKLVQ